MQRLEVSGAVRYIYVYIYIYNIRRQRVRSILCVISGFRREVYQNCVPLGCYALSSDLFLSDVSGQPIGHIFWGQDS
jgi:hypothetical protein